MRGIFNIAYFFIIVKYFFKSFFKDGFFINILFDKSKKLHGLIKYAKLFRIYYIIYVR